MIITKDDREIELMTEAGRIVALVNEIDQICDKIIREHGATPSFLHLYGFPNSVCTSINEVVVHGIPSNRKLKDGDIISVRGRGRFRYEGVSRQTKKGRNSVKLLRYQ